MKNYTMNQAGLFDPTTGSPSPLGLIGATVPPRVEPVALRPRSEREECFKKLLERIGVNVLEVCTLGGFVHIYTHAKYRQAVQSVMLPGGFKLYSSGMVEQSTGVWEGQKMVYKRRYCMSYTLRG